MFLFLLNLNACNTKKKGKSSINVFFSVREVSLKKVATEKEKRKEREKKKNEGVATTTTAFFSLSLSLSFVSS